MTLDDLDLGLPDTYRATPRPCAAGAGAGSAQGRDTRT